MPVPFYRAYIDDSKDKQVVVSGVIFGRTNDWRQLINPWRERLRKDGLDFFKSHDCDGLWNQFEKFRALENGRQLADKVREDLDQIIHESPVVTMGVVLPVQYHKELLANPERGKKIPKSAYVLSFQQVLAECALAMKRLPGRNNIISFVHDDGTDFQLLKNVYHEFKKRNPKYAKVMSEFVPLDDKIHPELQAADVAASVTRKYALAYANDPSVENLHRLETSMYKIGMWGMRQSDEFPSIAIGGDPQGRPADAEFVDADELGIGA